MNQPVFYRVSDTPVDEMSEDDLLRESDDLKREMVTIETRMGEKRAWTKAEGARQDYDAWVAKSKNFYGRLLIRYTIIKAALRVISRRKNS